MFISHAKLDSTCGRADNGSRKTNKSICPATGSRTVHEMKQNSDAYQCSDAPIQCYLLLRFQYQLPAAAAVAVQHTSTPPNITRQQCMQQCRCHSSHSRMVLHKTPCNVTVVCSQKLMQPGSHESSQTDIPSHTMILQQSLPQTHNKQHSEPLAMLLQEALVQLWPCVVPQITTPSPIHTKSKQTSQPHQHSAQASVATGNSPYIG